jgi:hypothetical protein
VSTGPDSTIRELLTPEQQAEFRSVVEERDGRYFWVTKDDRELHYFSSGLFENYVCIDGCGHIKVNVRTGDYFESFAVAIGTVTYYGKATVFGTVYSNGE